MHVMRVVWKFSYCVSFYDLLAEFSHLFFLLGEKLFRMPLLVIRLNCISGLIKWLRWDFHLTIARDAHYNLTFITLFSIFSNCISCRETIMHKNGFSLIFLSFFWVLGEFAFVNNWCDSKVKCFCRSGTEMRKFWWFFDYWNNFSIWKKLHNFY